MEFSRQEYWRGLPFPPPSESSQPPVPCVSCTGKQILYHCTTWEAFSTQRSPNPHKFLCKHKCVRTHTHTHTHNSICTGELTLSVPTPTLTTYPHTATQGNRLRATNIHNPWDLPTKQLPEDLPLSSSAGLEGNCYSRPSAGGASHPLISGALSGKVMGKWQGAPLPAASVSLRGSSERRKFASVLKYHPLWICAAGWALEDPQQWLLRPRWRWLLFGPGFSQAILLEVSGLNFLMAGAMTEVTISEAHCCLLHSEFAHPCVQTGKQENQHIFFEASLYFTHQHTCSACCWLSSGLTTLTASLTFRVISKFTVSEHLQRVLFFFL